MWNNKVTATIEDGKVVSQTETKNSKLDAFNSIATLSAFQWRHEMNDLTKRMGELRDSEGNNRRLGTCLWFRTSVWRPEC